MVCEKNMSFHDSYDTKISKMEKKKKKGEWIGPGFFMSHTQQFEQWHFQCSLGWGSCLYLMRFYIEFIRF